MAGRIDRKAIDSGRLAMTNVADSLEEMRRKQEELDKFLLESEEYFAELGREDVVRNRSLIPPKLKDFARTAEGKSLCFKGNHLIKQAGAKLRLTEDHLREIAFCSINPTYTIRNYCRIVSQDRGLINFDLYPFQEETVLTILSGKRHMLRSGRQSGKTMTIAATLLFYCMFNKNKNVAIVANKRSTAIEILERIQAIYTGLPMWLKPGVTKWNTQTVVFENGCKILTAATTGASIRGQSIACVDGDTFVHVRSEEFGEERISISDLAWQCNMYAAEEVLNNGRSFIPNTKYEVLTPSGFRKFDGVMVTENRQVVRLDSGLVCTPDHLVKRDDDFVRADSVWHEELPDTRRVFDLVEVGGGHEYLTDNEVSHNCLYIDEICFIRKKLWEEFDRSTFPVISAAKLAKIIISSTPKGHDHFFQMWTAAEKGRSDYTTKWVRWWETPGRDEAWKVQCLKNECKGDLEYFSQEFDAAFTTGGGTFLSGEGAKWMSSCRIDPIREDKLRGIKWFEDPIPGHSYVITIDCAEGKGLNFHAALVLDVSALPFKCVCTYKDNQSDLIAMPYIVAGLGREYNDAFLLIENNNTGAGAAKDLMHEIEYPNMHTTVIDRPEIKRKFTEPGVRTTMKVKKIGQDYLKFLLDNGKTLVPDERFEAETDNLVRNQSTQLWEASDEATNDDLYTALRLFAFFAKTESFENALAKGVKRSDVDAFSQKEKANTDESFARIFVKVDGDRKSSFSRKKKKNPNMVRIGERSYQDDGFRMR